MVSYGMVWYGMVIWFGCVSYPGIRKRTTHDVMSTARRDPTFGVWACSAASKMSRSCTTHLWTAFESLFFFNPRFIDVHWNTAWQQSATYCQDGLPKSTETTLRPHSGSYLQNISAATLTHKKMRVRGSLVPTKTGHLSWHLHMHLWNTLLRTGSTV